MYLRYVKKINKVPYFLLFAILFCFITVKDALNNDFVKFARMFSPLSH